MSRIDSAFASTLPPSITRSPPTAKEYFVLSDPTPMANVDSDGPGMEDNW
jgi:hypothetical protein